MEQRRAIGGNNIRLAGIELQGHTGRCVAWSGELVIRSLVAGAVLVLACASARGQEVDRDGLGAQLMSSFQLFNGCQPMALIVEDLHPAARKIGLTRESLVAAVEGRLRAARVFTNDDLISVSDHLYLRVSVEERAFNVHLELNKKLRDDRYPAFTGFAATWSRSSFGTHAGDADGLLSLVGRLLDVFMVEYLRVNEEACE